MIKLILLSLLFSVETRAQDRAPAWVSSLRSGEERFKLNQGSYTLFRQLGQDCETARKSLENDLQREFNKLVKYTTEIVYEDEKGCAVTVSVKGGGQEEVKELKEVLMERAEMAYKHAFPGTTYGEFQKFTNDSTPILRNPDINGLCRRGFNTYTESIHGPITLCWRDSVLLGYCVPSQEACRKRRILP